MSSALLQIFSGGVWTPWDGAVSATVAGSVVVSSITDPVAVSGITDPVAVSGITDPVTVSAGAAAPLYTRRQADWVSFNTPAVSTQATVTRAGVAGQKHTITSINAGLIAVVAQGVVFVRLLDGATPVWTNRFLLAAGQFRDLIWTGLNIQLSSGNDAVLEFTAAPAATNYEFLAMTGYTAA